MLLCSCSQAPVYPQAVPAPASYSLPPTSQAVAPTPEPEPDTTPAPKGTARYVTGKFPVDMDIEGLILAYMDMYYNSLARLELVDYAALENLFLSDSTAQALGNYTVWEYLIETRKLQLTDLSMVAYSYTMTTWQYEEQPDGSIRMRVMENSTQNFAAHPDVDSECIRVYHSFTFAMEDGEWKIRDHMQLDSLYFTLFGNTDEDDLMKAFKEPSFPADGIDEFMYERLQELLAQASDNVQRRRADSELLEPEVDHLYDRPSAVSYSQRYADERNAAWQDYGGYGGNCQNYTSQCLLAGGIPMDPYGDALWKWYSDTPNNRAGTTGRSAAWSSVTPFRTYVETNSGYGLSGQVDAPYYSGERGDLLQMGPEGLWKHTVIITNPVLDANGETVDYLVNSNTADLRDYPAGAYTYTNHALVKIWGWNER